MLQYEEAPNVMCTDFLTDIRAKQSESLVIRRPKSGNARLNRTRHTTGSVWKGGQRASCRQRTKAERSKAACITQQWQIKYWHKEIGCTGPSDKRMISQNSLLHLFQHYHE